MRKGLQVLQALEGFEQTGSIACFRRHRLLAFPCRLSIPDAAALRVPATTAWWVRLEPTYPAGEIDLLPDKSGGLEVTHLHQSFNEPGPENLPWRAGKLCLNVNIDALRSYGFDMEPRTAEHRLAWHVNRARHWLIGTGQGEFSSPGEPFELPDFRFGSGSVLAFAEDVQSLRTWERSATRYGYVGISWMNGICIATRFTDCQHQVIHGPQWGTMIRNLKSRQLGIWVRLDQVPVIEPWQAPRTWRELVDRCSAQHLELEKTVLDLAHSIPRPERKKDKGQRHPLLIGFPISARFGRPAERMHWVGFELPPLTTELDTIRGFRNRRPAMIQNDRQRLHCLRPLPWFDSQSWADDDLTGRGRLEEPLRKSRVALIGAGSLGSHIAETLVRGGVRHITVIDPQKLEAGNLVRHTLDLEDVGKPKADALVEHLNRIAPAVDALAVSRCFPDIPTSLNQRVHSADVLLDCTAEHAVLTHLEELDWPGARMLVSMALGFGCRRLYIFATRQPRFPRTEFIKAIMPWGEEDWDGVDLRNLPRPGAGCWQPLMPGAGHDVAVLARAAVAVLDELVASDSAEESPHFVVLEQNRHQGRFMGIRRRRGAAGPRADE